MARSRKETQGEQPKELQAFVIQCLRRIFKKKINSQSNQTDAMGSNRTGTNS